MSESKKGGWGGKREGAGRPKGSKNAPKPPPPPDNTMQAAIASLRKRAEDAGHKGRFDADLHHLAFLAERIEGAEEVREAIQFTKEYGVQVRHTDKAIERAEEAAMGGEEEVDWKAEWRNDGIKRIA